MVPPVRRAEVVGSRPRGQKRGRDGDGYREVVQRREGLRLHPAGRRRRGRVLPPHRDPGRRRPHPRGGTEGRVRGEEGAEGAPGGERTPDLTGSTQTAPALARRGRASHVSRRSAASSW